MNRLILFMFLCISQTGFGQTDAPLPYAEIPDYEKTYTPGHVMARMIDGLGYRFYWASDELREQDLSYKISEDARSTMETLEHIYELSVMILNAHEQKPNVRSKNKSPLTYAQLRAKTLKNLRKASQICRKIGTNDFVDHKIVFQRKNGNFELPYWNVINGPLADAIYHTGQIVSFRRASGNPINSKVNVLMGKNRE